MKKLFIIFGILILCGLSNPVKAVTFIDGLEDVPVMKGLNQITGETISFGNEESRFVETHFSSTKVGCKAVQKFYTETLRQLGWEYQGSREGTLIFYRESEVFEMVCEHQKPLKIKVTVKNKI